ncbi:MAG: tape measure protein [Phascolarctobacterium sp.]|uniref:tape measure protein n=1 Tax=Phascolarctobacterium sp. TaxID=2049039 RepID=UPI0026DC76C7|nr:tape measure protein [Phascolarctobacterium sp.]MDO4920925.1 tape measure protein [Phascolarctobacterium sp.]
MAEKNIEIIISGDSRSAVNALKGTAKVAEDSASKIEAAGKQAKQALESIGQGNTGKLSGMMSKIGSAATSAGNSISKGMGKAADAAKKATQNMADMNNAMNALAGAATLGVVGSIASSIAEAGVSCIKAAGQMEQYEIAFQTMLKSASRGTQMLKNLQEFAAKTPFDVPGVVETAQQLMAFGFKAEEIIPTLRTLGDAAAGLGKGSAGVQQMGYALGQISTSGTLKTQDVNQLATAGINVWEALSQAYGKSITEIKDLTEKGMIDSAEAVQIITASMDANFGGMMSKMETSINGLFSNIEETAGTFAANMGSYMVEAFNIKDKLQGISEALGNITESFRQAQQEGKSLTEALAEAVPPGVIAAIGAVAAVVGVTLVAATAAAIAAIGTAIGISAPAIAAVAGLGAMVSAVVVYWDDFTEAALDAARIGIAGVLSAVTGLVAAVPAAIAGMAGSVVSLVGEMWESAMGYTPDWVNDIKSACDNALALITSWAGKALDLIREVFSAQQKIMSDSYWQSSMANTDDDNAASDSPIPKAKADVAAPAISTPKSSSGARGSDDLSRKEAELQRLTEALAKSSAATQDLTDNWDKLNASVAFEDMSAYDQVYQKIKDEKNARLAAVDEQLAKQKSAVDEAEAYRAAAAQSGDAQAIADAEKLYNDRNALYQEALKTAEGYETEHGQVVLGLRDQIEQQANEQALSRLTEFQALKAAQQEAMNEMSYEQFLEYLNSEQEAKLVALQQEQELRQQLLDWRMESQQTMLEFELQAGESIKNQLASGFADLITQGGSFSKTLQDIGKNIVNMFVQFMVKRQAAALLESALGKKEEGETTARALAEGKALVAPAVQKSIAVCGPLTGMAAYSGAVAAMTAAGIASLGIGAAATGGRRKGLTLVGEEGPELVNFTRPGMVYTAGETASILSSGINPAMVGMATYRPTLGASSSPEAGGVALTANLYNYGDINTGNDVEELFDEFNETLLAGLRGG